MAASSPQVEIQDVCDIFLDDDDIETELASEMMSTDFWAGGFRLYVEACLLSVCDGVGNDYRLAFHNMQEN